MKVDGFRAIRAAFIPSKDETTTGEYTAFLNTVAADDPAGLYHAAMAGDGTSAGIGRSGRAVARNTINPNTRVAPTFFLPTENAWDKAAYFSHRSAVIGSCAEGGLFGVGGVG